MSAAMHIEIASALDTAYLAERCGLDVDPWARAFLRDAYPRRCLVAARQVGKSTICAVAALSVLRHRPGSVVVAVSKSERQSAELIRKVTDLHARIGGKLARSNETTIEFQSGSRMISVPGSNPDAARGFSPHLLLADEGAWIPDQTFEALMPSLGATGGSCVLISSAGAASGFMWRATESETWNTHRVTWRDCPRLHADAVEEARRSLPAGVFAAEYECVWGDGDTSTVFSAADIHAALSDGEVLF